MCSFFDPISFRGRYQTCPNFDSTVREYIERLNLFTPQQVTAMKSEWAAYYREVHFIQPTDQDLSPSYRMDKATDFWKESSFKNLKSLALVARYAFLVVPSSAAAERVFSVLKHSLSLVQMHQALEELTELMVKLNYNHRADKVDFTHTG